MTISVMVFKAVAVLAAVSLLTACNPQPGTPASEWQWLNDQPQRADLFQKCLVALPAGPVSTHYNDWSEVVDSCEDSANRQSKRLAREGKNGLWYYQDGSLVKYKQVLTWLINPVESTTRKQTTSKNL